MLLRNQKLFVTAWHLFNSVFAGRFNKIRHQNTFVIDQASATVSGGVRLVCRLGSLIPDENFWRRVLVNHLAHEHRIWSNLPATFSILHFSCHGCISDSIYELSMNGHQIQHILRIKCGSRGGTGGPDPPPPPGKSQVIWVSIGNKQLDPPTMEKAGPPPLENNGPPLGPWKMTDFFEIDHLTSVK